MKNSKRAVSLFAALVLALTSVPVTAMATEGNAISKTFEDTLVTSNGYSYLDGYNKVWGDEFNGDALSTTDWKVETHDPKWVNNELQAYVDSDENIQVKDGRLNLIPIRKSSKDIVTSEILKNKDFSEGKNKYWAETIANWNSSVKADASSAVADGAITYTINNAGEDLWQVQLKQAINIQSGATYTAKFNITSSIGRKIESGIQHNGGAVAEGGDDSGNYDTYVSDASTYSAGVEKPVELSFTADKNDTYVSFFISMGQKVNQTTNPGDAYEPHTIKISNLSIIESGSGAGSGSTKETEILKNRDFSEGENNLGYWTNASLSTTAVTAADGRANYSINGFSAANVWDNMLFQNIDVKAGGEYEVTLDLESSIDRDVLIVAQDENYTEYGSEKVSLSADVQKPVTMNISNIDANKSLQISVRMGNNLMDYLNNSDNDANRKIYLGETNHTVKISNVSAKVTTAAGGQTVGEELITNGDFSIGDLTGWSESKLPSANSSVAAGTVTYTIDNPQDKNEWDNQLFQTVTLEKGYKYKLSLKAMSSVDRKITVFAQNASNSEIVYAQSQKLQLTKDTEKDITLDIDFTNIDDAQVNVGVKMGNFANSWDDPPEAYGDHNIDFSDFSLVKIEEVEEDDEEIFSYTSGRINTQGIHTFKYGLFEMSARVPRGMGYLPAFWLMPNDESIYGQWPRCGEIDCMEVMGQETNKAYGTIHYGNPHNENQGTYFTNGDFATEDHVYACEWLPGKIVWYIDGNKFFETSDWFTATEGQGKITYPAPFDQEFYVILNLAIGGSWVGYPDESTQYGEDNAFSVDYVRVYQKDSYNEDVEEPVKEEIELREPDLTGNYIVNGEFSDNENLSDEKDWVFKTTLGGQASAQIKDNSIEIKTENEGTADYSIQLYQANVPLEKGSTYEVAFDAKASAARTMNVDVKAPDRGYKQYMSTFKPEVTTELKSFTTEFVMNDDTDANGRLEFNMGKFGRDDIVISNVTLKKIEGPEEEDAPAKTVLADGNYIYNGKFQEGKNYLGYWDVNIGGAKSAKVTGLKDGRRLEVTMAEDAEEPFTISQKDLAFKPGKKYVVSFDAAADKAVRLDVTVGGKNKTIEIPAGSLAKGDEKTYTLKLSSTARFTNNDVKIVISPEASATVKLDNVSMKEDLILKNGDFSDGWTGFSMYQYDGTDYSKGIDSIAEGNDQAAEFTIKNAGDDNWNIQLIQYVSLEKDKKYKLSYRAKSSIARTIWAQIQHDPDNKRLPDHAEDDYRNYAGTEAVALTSEWQTFEKTFVMSETNPDAKFNICLGTPDGMDPITTEHKVTIDDISIVEVTEGGNADEPAEVETVSEIADVVYTGAKLKPAVAVYDGDTKLKEKKDYTVKYFNNVNANSSRKVNAGMGADFNDTLPYAVITYKNKDKGSVKVNFNIDRRPIGDFQGALTKGTSLKFKEQLAVSKKPQAVFGSLKSGNRKLNSKYYDIKLLSDNGTEATGAKVPANASGVFTLKVKGKVNYTGTIVKTVTVAPKEKLLKYATISLGKNLKKVNYTGKKIAFKPGVYNSADKKIYEVIDEAGNISSNSIAAKDVFTVKIAGKSLTYGKDFVVSYKNNKAVGKATLTINGIGEYAGTKSASFVIKGKPFSKKTVVITGVEDKEFAGVPVKQNARLSYKVDATHTKPIYSGSDYTVKYLKNDKKGTATIIFTGKASAGYTGTIKKTFKIK